MLFFSLLHYCFVFSWTNGSRWTHKTQKNQQKTKSLNSPGGTELLRWEKIQCFTRRTDACESVDIHLTASADCTARRTCHLGLGSFISPSSRPDQRFYSSKTFFKKENAGNLKRWLAGTWMISSQAASTCSQAARGRPPGWTCPKHLEARHQNSGSAHLFISPHSQTKSWVGALTALTQSGTSMHWSSSQHEVSNQPETPEPLIPSITRLAGKSDKVRKSIPGRVQPSPVMSLTHRSHGPSLRGPIHSALHPGKNWSTFRTKFSIKRSLDIFLHAIIIFPKVLKYVLMMSGRREPGPLSKGDQFTHLTARYSGNHALGTLLFVSQTLHLSQKVESQRWFTFTAHNNYTEPNSRSSLCHLLWNAAAWLLASVRADMWGL